MLDSVKKMDDLTITTKNIPSTALHKCWYIIHKDTGHVSTSQFKAWNDTVRMIMWLELIIQPLKIASGKFLIWMDNCGSHKTEAVDLVMKSIGINLALYPPNMTAILQVLDLIFNGPLKAHVRNLRAWRLVAAFKIFKLLWEEEQEKDPSNRKKPKFVSPKPNMIESMHDLIALFANELKKTDFMAGITSSFIKTGSVPFSGNEFHLYKEEHFKDIKSGVMPTETRSVIMNEEDDFQEALECFLYDDNEENNVDEIAAALSHLDNDLNEFFRLEN